MKNNFMYEAIVAGVLMVLTLLLLNPFHFWMPDMMVLGMLALVAVCFGIFAVFVMKESVVDERDVIHRMHAGRVAFLAGSLVVTIGILVQAIDHRVDVWLVLALVLMILSKFAMRFYSQNKM